MAMAPAAALALTIGTGALGAATSYAQARGQNRAARRAADSSRRAAEVETRQITRAAELEAEKRLNRQEQVAGRVRVAAARSGFATSSGDFERFARQNEFDTAIDLATLEENRQAQIDRVLSGLDARLADISSRTSNSLLSAFTGGLGGIQAGLAITGGLDQFGNAFPSTPAATPRPPRIPTPRGT